MTKKQETQANRQSIRISNSLKSPVKIGGQSYPHIMARMCTTLIRLSILDRLNYEYESRCQTCSLASQFKKIRKPHSSFILVKSPSLTRKGAKLTSTADAHRTVCLPNNDNFRAIPLMGMIYP